MNNGNLTPIEEQPIKNEINLPNLKNITIEKDPKPKEDLVEIPNWNIEPPIEINRGQNDIR